MTLEHAVKSLMKSTFEWIETTKNKEAHMIINFSSLFIHYTKSILRNTEEFKENSFLGFLKNKNLDFDFNKGKLKYVKWLNPDKNVLIFNELVQKEIDEYYNITNVKLPVRERIYQNNQEELLNLQTLENFKF